MATDDEEYRRYADARRRYEQERRRYDEAHDRFMSRFHPEREQEVHPPGRTDIDHDLNWASRTEPAEAPRRRR